MKRRTIRHALAEGLRHFAFGIFALGAFVAAVFWYPAYLIDDR